jgi:D-alanyl-D-alanine carboxypeptidase
MNLTQTWSNSSGLGFNPNYSTPEAITLLTAVAMRHELFAKIVNTRSYDLEVKNDRYGLTRSVTWKNTNKLL